MDTSETNVRTISTAVTGALSAASLLLLVACNEPSATDGEASSDAAMARYSVAAVFVLPDTATLGVGATIQFSVRLVDRNGRTLTGRAVTWRVSDTAVAQSATLASSLAEAPEPL